MKLSQLKRQIEELDAKATGGPWVTGSIPWKVWANGGRNTVCDVKSVDDEIPIGNGLALSKSMASNRDFIALSRTALPELLRRLLAAEEALSKFADGDSWFINGICDPSGMNYDGEHIAASALATIRGEEE